MTEVNGVFGRVENETLMRLYNLVDARIVTKVNAHKKFRIGEGEVRQMPRTIFGFFKLFRMHQNDEFGLDINSTNVFTHT